MSSPSSSNLESFDDDDSSDQNEMDNQLENAFGDQMLNYIMSSEKYLNMIDRLQQTNVKQQKVKVNFAQEIAVKAYNDYMNSFYKSRSELQQKLTQSQVQYIKDIISSYFLNVPLLRSDKFSSKRQVITSIVITQSIIDEILQYIRAIQKAAEKLSVGLQIPLEDMQNSDEFIQMKQKMDQLIQQYAQMQWQFENVEDEQRFAVMVEQLFRQDFNDVFSQALQAILLYTKTQKNEKMKQFLKDYRYYVNESELHLPENLKIFAIEMAIQTDPDNLSARLERLKSSFAQCADNAKLAARFSRALEEQVDGMIAGREAVQFHYYQYNNLFSAGDQQNLSVFTRGQKGDLLEYNYMEIVPFLVQSLFSELVAVCTQRDTTDAYIASLENAEVRGIAQTCIQRFRDCSSYIISQYQYEERYVRLLRSIRFRELEFDYQKPADAISARIQQDYGLMLQDNRYMNIINDYDVLSQQLSSLIAQMEKMLRAQLFIFVGHQANNSEQLDFEDVDDEQWRKIAALLTAYTLMFKYLRFIRRMNSIIEQFQAIFASEKDVDEALNPDLAIIYKDMNMTVEQAFQKFDQNDTVCDYDEKINKNADSNSQMISQLLSGMFQAACNANPYVLSQCVRATLENGTVSVLDARQTQSAQVAQQGAQLFEAQKQLFSRLNDRTKALDAEDTTLFSGQASQFTYSPNDPFQQVAFIEKKPLLLYYRQFARGQNRTQFLYIAHLHNHKENVKVEFDGVVKPDFEDLPRYSPINNVFDIQKSFTKQVVQNIVQLLEQQALTELSVEAFQYFQYRLQQPRFNPLQLKYGDDQDPTRLSRPFISDDKIKNEDKYVFVAAEKGYRICTVVPANLLAEDVVGERNQTTFVVTDNYGRFIDAIQLKNYEQQLPNPMKMRGTIDFKQQIASMITTAERDQTNDSIKLIDRERLDIIISQFFQQLTQQQVQRVIDEAQLMDFLVKNAVCTVGVLQESFSGDNLKRQLINTLSYINLPFPDYYDDNKVSTILPISQYVRCPESGDRDLVGRNVLYLDDYLFRRIRLSPHLRKLIIADIPSDIAMGILSKPLLFDVSFDKQEKPVDACDPSMYVQIATDYLLNNFSVFIASQSRQDLLKHFGGFSHLWNSDLLQYTGKYNISTLQYDELEEPPFTESRERQNLNQAELQKTYFLNQQPKQVTKQVSIATKLGIIAARCFLDPAAAICWLTFGENAPENLLATQMVGFLPEFMPFNPFIQSEKPICQTTGRFYDQLKLRFCKLLIYTQQLEVSKLCYDFNLPMIAPHYVFALSMLPGLNLRKLQIIWQNAHLFNIVQRHQKKSSRTFTNLNLRDIESLDYLYSSMEQLQQLNMPPLKQQIAVLTAQCNEGIDNISAKIEQCSDFNMYSELINTDRNEKKNVRYIKSKQQLLQIILQQLTIEQIYYKQLESLVSDVTASKCEEYLKKSRKITSHFSVTALREKLCAQTLSCEKYIYALMVSGKLRFDAKASIGQLMSEFTHSDYQLLKQTMEMLYGDLTSYISITNDVLLSYPGSPYCQPFNTDIRAEYSNIVSKIAILQVNSFLPTFALELFQTIPRYEITTASLKEYEGLKQYTTEVSTVFNEFGEKVSYDPEKNIDTERVRNFFQQKQLKTCLIENGVIGSLSPIDALPLDQKKQRIVFLILQIIDYINKKLLKAEFYDTLEISSQHIQKIRSLTDFYSQLNIQTQERDQLLLNCRNEEFQFIFQQLYNIAETNIISLQDCSASFQKSNLKGIYSLCPSIAEQLLYNRNSKLSLANIFQLCEISGGQMTAEQQEQYNFEKEFYAVMSKNEMPECFDINQLLSNLLEQYQYGSFSFDQKSLELISNGSISALLADKLLLTNDNHQSLRKLLGHIIYYLRYFDKRIDQLFQNCQFFEKQQRNFDYVEPVFQYIQQYKKDTDQIITTYCQQKDYEQDQQYIFLLQTKQQNPKLFSRFQELQVEIPKGKRDIYLNSSGNINSYDVNCTNIMGLKGIIPAGGKEQEIDLASSFTAYIDAVLFRESMLCLTTFVHLDEQKKINISSIIKNIRENQWRANLLESILSNEASYIDNTTQIATNVKNSYKIVQNIYQKVYFDASEAQIQQTSIPDRSLMEVNDEQLKKSLCFQKLVISYALSDYYAWNKNLVYAKKYQQYSEIESKGLKQYCDVIIKSQLLSQNYDVAFAAVSLLLNSIQHLDKKSIDILLSKNNIVKNITKQLQNMLNKSETDMHLPELYDVLSQVASLQWYFKLILAGSFINSELFSQHINFIQSQKYVQKYKNDMQAAFQRTQFKRDISHPYFQNLKIQQINDYFLNHKDRECVFFPAQNSYNYIYLAIQTPKCDSSGCRFALYKVYEDEQYKQRDDNQVLLQKLSNKLFMVKFQNFPDIQNQVVVYEDLNDVRVRFVAQIIQQYNQIKSSSKFISYADRSKFDQSQVKTRGFAFYFSDCQSNRLTYMKYNVNHSTKAEHVYIINDGVVFRNKYIYMTSFYRDFCLQWSNKNWNTWEVSNQRGATTVYKKDDDEEE